MAETQTLRILDASSDDTFTDPLAADPPIPVAVAGVANKPGGARTYYGVAWLNDAGEVVSAAGGSVDLTPVFVSMITLADGSKVRTYQDGATEAGANAHQLFEVPTLPGAWTIRCTNITAPAGGTQLAIVWNAA